MESDFYDCFQDVSRDVCLKLNAAASAGCPLARGVRAAR